MPIEHYYNLSLLEAFVKREGYYQRVEIECLAPARIVATIIRNAHSRDNVSVTQFMPLSIDQTARDDAYEYIKANADAIYAWAIQTTNKC